LIIGRNTDHITIMSVIAVKTMIKERWSLTGDPFVDNGIWAITILSGKDNPANVSMSDTERAIDRLKDLLFSGAIDSLLRMLWVNHPVYQNSYTPEQRKTAVANILNDLLEWANKDTSGNICPICGINQAVPRVRNKPRTQDYNEITASRTYIPMLGSGKLSNFFPQGSSGIRICASCFLATQFLPFMVWKSKNLLLAHSSSPEVMFVLSKMQEKASNEEESQLIMAKATGGAVRRQNAIYNVVVNIIQELEVEIDIPNLTFYDFTNYGQSPNVEGIYSFPNTSFKFLNEINGLGSWSEWQNIVRRGFPEWALKRKNKKQTTEEIEKEAYRSKQNYVYDNLLANRSIIKYFTDKRKKRNLCSWELFSLYLKMVKHYES